MKLNIIFTEENHIDNYQNVLLSSRTYKEEIENLPRKSCEHIIITDAINRIEYDEALEIITKCADSLREDGQITISIVDFDTLCSAYCSGDLPIETTNGLIVNTKCVLEYSTILGLLGKNGIKIISSKTDSLLYLIDGAKDAI